MRALSLFMMLVATAASAEGGWLTARGRLSPQLRLEAWGGTTSFGAGVVAPDQSGNAALSAEASYAYFDRTVELRGARVWQLTAPRFATASATVSGVGHLVPEGFDLGLGPHAALSLALGGARFSVDLSLETGADFFARALLVRLPQRGTVAVNVRLGDFGLSAQARVGADFVPGANFVGRAELVLSVSWFGLIKRDG